MEKLIKWFKKLSTKTKKILIGSTATAILAGFGYFGIFKNDILPIIKDVVTPEPRYEICEQDGNVRGIFLDKMDINNSKYLYFKMGLEEKVTVLKYFLKEFKDREYKCIFHGALSPFDEDCNFKWRINENNQILFSIDIYDENNCLVGKVDESMFVLNKNCQFTWNSDKYGFEIVDNNFNVVVSFDYKSPSTISFQGYLYGDNGGFVVRNSTIAVMKNIDKEEWDDVRKSIKPLFEYLGDDWFGKRKSYD